jgi:hypothetical protein
MRYQLIIDPDISRAIGGFGLGRTALLKLLTTLRDQLENHAANYRQNRNPVEPDRSFLYELVLWDHGLLRILRFVVDDATAGDRLILDSAEEI